MKKGYYQADCTNGVVFYDELMDLDVEILRPDIFFETIPILDENEIIYTFMDKSDHVIYNEIDHAYGIDTN